MTNIANSLIKAQLQKAFYDQAAKKLGANGEQSKALAQKAMSVLLKGLAENAQTENGAIDLRCNQKNLIQRKSEKFLTLP